MAYSRKKHNDRNKLVVIALLTVCLLIVLPLTIIGLSSRDNLFAKAFVTSQDFQPTAPYHAVYFYPWSQNPNTDSSWSYWSDLLHTPPVNWFSNYLPDPNPNAFDPATELYSSKNDQIIYWQLSKMAEAKQEVAISSWWGQNHKTDIAFRHIITDVMNRPDNPYPNLRWAIYYEKEGDADPSVNEIVSDINYIKANYASQPGMLKINNLPVVFVYAGASDSATFATRWAQAKQQTPFYDCLKVFSGYASDPNQPDCWHQYAPAARSQNFPPYYSDVSAGFWKDGEASPRLPRDINTFKTAVQAMEASNTTWKVITTWNEWGEGSSVEPGDQVIQSKTGAAVLDPNGVPFKNTYIDALNQLLPPLEQGVGIPTSTPTPLPTNTPTPLPTSTPIPLPTATPTPAVVSLAATADTYVDSSNKTKNFGTAISIYADSSPTKISYLKFDLTPYAGKTILSAKLKIQVSSDPSPAVQSVKLVSSTSWNETAMTYNTKPALGATLATISSGNKANVSVTVDITSGLVGKAGQIVSVGIDSASSDGINFTSRETATKPTLILQLK